MSCSDYVIFNVNYFLFNICRILFSRELIKNSSLSSIKEEICEMISSKRRSAWLTCRTLIVHRTKMINWAK